MKKRIFAAAAALVMVFGAGGYLPDGLSFAAVQASAMGEGTTDDGWVYAEHISGDNGWDSIEITGYTGEGGAVEIPSEINGMPVVYIYDLCKNDNITELTIPESVTQVNGSAFRYNTALKKVTFPANIGYVPSSVCEGCTALETVVIEEGIRSISQYAFDGCTSLTDVSLPSTLVSVCRDAFRGTKYLNDRLALGGAVIDSGVLINGTQCKGSYYVPDGVRIIADYAFDENYDLTSIYISEGVEYIGEGALASCSKLATISFPSTVRSIKEKAFFGTKWLKDIRGSGQMAIVNGILIDGAGCKGDVVIPEGVHTIIRDAFYANKEITNVSFPSTLTGIPESCFWGCDGLTSLNIPGNVEEIKHDAFNNCSSLSSVTFNAGLKSIGSGAFFKTPIESVVLPEGFENIGWSSFSNCDKLSQLTLNDDIRRIERDAFYACPSLKEVTIPYDVEYIGDDAFGVKQGSSFNQDIVVVDGFKIHCYYGTTGGKYVREHNMPVEYILVDLKNANITIPKYQYTYKGEPIKPSPKIVYRGEDLLIWSSYVDVEYIDNDALGRAEMRVTGKNLFEGQMTIYYGIVAAESDHCGDKIIWKELDTGVLDISGSGAMYNFSDEAPLWFEDHKKMNVVRISDGVTYLGSNTFNKWPELERAEIPDSVKKIADNAFDSNSEDLVIVGGVGSCAEKYAKEHGIKFRPRSINIDKVDIKLPDEDYIYNGKPLTPVPVLTYDGQALKEGTDYVVSYEDNDAVGTGKVIIIGKGDFIGKKEMTFLIADADDTTQLGDANLDGKVNAADITIAAAHIKGLRTLQGVRYNNADVDKNGKITSADIVRIAAHIKGLKTLK